MSEPTWAQRKAWNNDGMDPDWRPNTPSVVSDPIKKLERLILAVGKIAEPASKVPEDKNINGKLTIHSYSITAASHTWVEIAQAYEEVKFK